MAITYDGFESVTKVESGPAFVYEVSNGTIDTSTTPTITSRWLNSGVSLGAAKAYEPFYLDSPTYIRYAVIAGFAQSGTTYSDALGRAYFS